MLNHYQFTDEEKEYIKSVHLEVTNAFENSLLFNTLFDSPEIKKALTTLNIGFIKEVIKNRKEIENNDSNR